MLCVYPADCTDFSNNGMGVISPSSAIVKETLNGSYELEIVHPYDAHGKWKRLADGNIVRAPVPSAMTPQVALSYKAISEGKMIYEVNTKKNPLALRSTTTKKYKKLGKYKKGTQVIVLDRATDTMFEVATPDGKHGYMPSESLKFIRNESLYADATDAVMEPRQLRDQPFRIYRIVPELDKVTAYARHIFYQDCGLLLAGRICGKAGVRARPYPDSSLEMWPSDHGENAGDLRYQRPRQAGGDDDGRRELIILKVTRIAPKYEGKKLKVAAYCRVSTDKSSQEESLETQQRTYEAMIRGNPNWEFAGIYVDEGRSGVTDKREGFQQMIADAKAGKINKIFVKSISRFGRDILLCRQYVEELAEHNVSVCFEREGIDSLNPGTLMILSLSAAIAQDESRSNSENHHWSNRRRTELGIYKIGNNQVLGYDADKDGKPVPNKDAWIVKMIFELYAEGKEIHEIMTALETAGAHSLRSEQPIPRKQIKYILRNEIYVGDKLLQKRNPKDLLTKQPDPKRLKQSNYLSDDHEPIIPRELWDAVQQRFDKTNGKTMNRKNGHFLSGKLYCGKCGGVFRRKTLKNRAGYTYKIWKCRGREEGLCTAPIWKEDELIEEISGKLGITCDEAGIADMGTILIGDEIERTA